MSEDVITDAAQLTPGRLTTILHRAGVLDQGQVRAIDSAEIPHRSLPRHLTIRYSNDASPSAPRRLYLKLENRPEIAGGLGQQEVAAYRALAGHREKLPMVLRCYDAARDAERRISHLLLEDFSSTHLLPSWPVPKQVDREQIIDCTARFHAYWWEHRDLQHFSVRDPNIEFDCTDEQTYQSYVRRYQDAFGYFADFMGDRMAPADRRLYGQVLACLPTLWERYLVERFVVGTALTLIQGDSHWCQFACPNNAATDQTLMFDLECLHVGLPAFDLAYRLPLSWTPEQRWAMEDALIERYLAGLQKYGVRGYDRDLFWLDYRISTLILTLDPLWLFTAQHLDRADRTRWGGELPGHWPAVYRHITSNFHNLHCEELLG
jgi:hypothetical protein